MWHSWQTPVRFAVACVLCLSVLNNNGFAQSSRETISHVLPRIVKIFGAGGIRSLHSYSTGFLVSPEGHIVTIWSHVLDADEVTVVLNDGRRFGAKVLGAEPPLELAVLKIDEDGLDLPYFDIEQAGDAGPGTRILGFSNMFKVATGDEPVSVIHGVIASKTKLSARRGSFEIPYDGPVYVVDAVTNNSGAGGGVIASRDGRLLGMIGKELRNSQSNTWVNYAIPVTELKKAVQEIISGRFESSANKKTNTEESPANYGPRDFGLLMVPDVLFRTPAYIDSVAKGSQTEKLGLKPDDLVLFVNDELIQSVRMLRREFGRLEAGDLVRLVVRRGDKLVTVELDVKAKK